MRIPPRRLIAFLLAAVILLGPGTAAAQARLTVGSGLNAPNGVAVDASGNVFVADTGNGAVKEILAPDYGTIVQIATLNGNFTSPAAIAIDGSGNVFVADIADGTVKEILAAGGYTAVNTISSGFSEPTGIAVDGDDNVFIADFGSNHLYEILAGSGYATHISLGSGYGELSGVAVDSRGNLFTADQIDGIQELTAASGYQTVANLASGNQNIVQPFGIALDGAGNVYFTDLALGQLAEIPIAGGYSTVVPRLGMLDEPEGLTIDGAGDIFVADPNNGSGVIDELVTATTTGLVSSLNPATLGAGVNLTANVAAIAPGSSSLTGSVTFVDGSATLGTVSLTAGAASFATTTLAPGSHAIAALYSGDDNFAPSTSAVLTEVVNPAPTVTTLTSSLDPSSSGQTVTFTAFVPAVGGSITFMDGSTPLGAVALASGEAALSTAALGVGSHPITASYSGDSEFAASGSATLTQIVNAVVPAPAVGSLGVPGGPLAGGTVVVITGTNLAGASAVRFGATAAAGFTVDSATQITAQAPAHAAGAVDVRVVTAGGTSAAGPADHYTYVALPVVGSVAPRSGPLAGGSVVTIGGSNLSGASAVSFGGTPAAGFSVVSAGRITATAPAGVAGAVDVTVTTLGGMSAAGAADRYSYAAAPTVTSVGPSSGPVAGGRVVTITGTNLTGASAVSFGGVAATGISVVGATELQATAPAHGAGSVDVVVTTPGGTSTTGAGDQFVYLAAPTVASVSPAAGSLAGGTSVTITGSNLTGATVVRFGTTPASNVVVVNAGKITATAPAHDAATVDVIVTTAGGTSALGARDAYTFVAAPVVSALTRRAGRRPAAGRSPSSAATSPARPRSGSAPRRRPASRS